MDDFRIPEKLKILRELFNLTQEEMANKLEMKQSQYSLVENGKQAISMEKIGLLNLNLGVSPLWIMMQTNSIPLDKEVIMGMTKTRDFRREMTSSIIDVETTSEPNYRNLIPFYDDVVTMGSSHTGGSVSETHTSASEYIDTGDWFTDATAAIRHYGESMIEYPSGCILALREVIDKDLIVPGRDYMIETDEYRVTKRIQLGKDDNHFTAYSTNPETYADGRLIHEPFPIPKSSIRRMSLVLGYVVKKNGGTMVFSNKNKK